MKRALSAFTLIAAVLAIAVPAQAEVFITYGVLDGGQRIIDLLADTADQAVQLFIAGLAGDGGADSLELNLQVGDGGPALGGSDTMPTMSRPDLITGTVWQAAGLNAAGNAASQGNPVETPLARQSTVETGLGLGANDPLNLVTADGLLGTVFFDTTGILTDQMITFSLTVNNGATSFPTVLRNGATNLDTNAPDGFLRIRAVPEPGSVLVLVGLGLFGIVRRKRA